MSGRPSKWTPWRSAGIPRDQHRPPPYISRCSRLLPCQRGMDHAGSAQARCRRKDQRSQVYPDELRPLSEIETGAFGPARVPGLTENSSVPRRGQWSYTAERAARSHGQSPVGGHAGRGRGHTPAHRGRGRADLPFGSILIPLLARDRTSGAGASGLLLGAQSAGTIASILTVGKRRAGSGPGLVAVGALFVIARASSPSRWPGPCSSRSPGVPRGHGNRRVRQHLGPVLPQSYLARIRTLLTWCRVTPCW